MFGKKGFITMLEMIIVIIILLVAFGIIFPGFNYKSKWTDVLLLVRSRDVVVAADRVGQLYNYSFSTKNMQNFVSSASTGQIGFVSGIGVEGALKSDITVACNCTNDDLNNLISWFRGLKINGREITMTPCYTNLEKINPCIDSSDVLLIFGSNDLSRQSYLNLMENYLRSGGGIIEISDLNPASLDNVQKTIFGLGSSSSTSQSAQSNLGWFRTSVDLGNNPNGRPANASMISYGPWKYFYHVPLTLFAASASGVIPTEAPLSPPSCGSVSVGNFSLHSTMDTMGSSLMEIPYIYKFWICDSGTVYLDTNLNGAADVAMSAGDKFSIPDYFDSGMSDFTLTRIASQNEIAVSFIPEYSFSEFSTHWPNQECICQSGLGKCSNTDSGHGACRNSPKMFGDSTNLLAPSDGRTERILLQTDKGTLANDPIPMVILNSTYGYKAAWMANFVDPTGPVKTSVGDDERQLLISLLLWASNKRSTQITAPTRVGAVASYVNSANNDVFEVYRLDLGLGYPF
jgi:hypothetical protein